MKYQHPLRQILSQTRPYWDQDKTRPAVRRAFNKALQCHTPELGGEVYASGNEEWIFYNTCKSRPCSSCGYRQTVQWQRERWAALPDVPYKGITLTMPQEFWPFFRDNPRLAKALPFLAANLIQMRVRATHGLRVGVIAILHTFNGKLEFNSHVHTIVTAGGLHESSSRWVSRAYYNRDAMMQAWRRAVIKLLRAALRAGRLRTEMTNDQVEELLTSKETCWWSINIRSLKSKEHFLRYAGRYVRRPPIAQRRITYIGDRIVTFWYNDKRLGRRARVQCSSEEFVDRWAQHLPERYEHAVRNFGLFGPRTLSQTSAAIFLLLGQRHRLRPKPRRWADSLKRDFGHDPLIDTAGIRMRWIRRVAPIL